MFERQVSGGVYRLAAAGVVISGMLLMAQQVPTISVSVKVVNVLAAVRDKHGQIVRNLTKDDFQLEEDGRPQTLKYFSRETDLPLTVGLMVDTSLSQRNLLGEERSASYTFLDQMLRPERDLAFVLHFDEEVELLQDVTGSKEKLRAALNEVELDRPQLARQGGGRSGGSNPGGGQSDPNDPNSGGNPGGYPGGGRRGGGGGGRRARGTLLYDAVYLASNELMRNQNGRKALILLTDGVDQGSKYSIETAIEEAQSTDTLVYGILFADPNAYREQQRPDYGRGGWGRRGGGMPPRMPQPQEQHADGKKILQRMAKETGGRFFEVSKKEPIDEIYAQIQEELRSQYNLGFSSDKPASESEYRKLKVTIPRQKDLQIQARDGYYAKP